MRDKGSWNHRDSLLRRDIYSWSFRFSLVGLLSPTSVLTDERAKDYSFRPAKISMSKMSSEIGEMGQLKELPAGGRMVDVFTLECPRKIMWDEYGV